MEVQMAARPTGRSTPPHHHTSKAVPAYLRAPAGSCHHACKYGAAHAAEDSKDAQPHRPAPPKPRKQPAAPAPDRQSSRVLGKVRSVFRRRAGDSTRAAAAAEKAAAARPTKEVPESVEWKDIVAYDAASAHGAPSSPQHGDNKAVAADAARKKDATNKKGSKITEQVVDDGVRGAHPNNARPPKGKNTKKPATLLVEKMSVDQEILRGYQTLSPSLMQSRASLLRDLQAEMAAGGGATDLKEAAAAAATHSHDQEEEYAAAAEPGRPIVPAHRRAKSMGVGISSRSGRHPLARQPSRGSSSSGTAFKLRSRSTRAPALPPPEEEEEEERPARPRSRRGDHQDPAAAGTGTGRGIQLRIRSLRRRGVGVGGGGGAGPFVVPAVALRHQRTLEKKRSQRLYNNVIEETASRLAKTRKSRVKALVGAFESVISKIAK